MVTRLQHEASIALGWLALLGGLGGAVCLLYLVGQFCDVWTMSSPRISQYLETPLDVPMLDGNRVKLHGPIESGLLTIDSKAVIHIFRTLRLPTGSTVLMRCPVPSKDFRFVLNGYRKSISGLWRGTYAVVRCSGALEGEFTGFPGHRSKKWGSRLSSKTKSIAPFLDVSLPLDRVSLEAPLERRRVDIQVELGLDLPVMQV